MMTTPARSEEIERKVTRLVPRGGGDQDGAPATRGQTRMAERFVIENRDDLRYVHGIDWHIWDSCRWAQDEDGEPIRRVVHSVKNALREVPDLPDKDAQKALLDDARKAESASGINGVLTIASNLHPVTTAHKRLDRNALLFNTPDGTLDLETAEIRPHDRSDLITKVTGAKISDERSPIWEGFLERILPDEEVRRFVQRLFGYAMLGEVREHVMPIFTGSGANGKGTLRDALLHAFGDYAHEIDPTMLMASKHERHGTFKMQLRGRRLVFCSETEKGRRFAEAEMKRLVGGDPIEANLMHRDPITFKPTHTLIMLTNHLPGVSGDDPAVKRRMLVVPFDVVIPLEERDGTLPARLKDEAGAILRWAFEGWLEYQRIGLAPPAVVRARTEEYLVESDAVGRFLEDRCMLNAHAHIRARDLWLAWQRWAERAGERVGTETEFGRTMATRGATKTRDRLGMIYNGIGLLNESGDEETS